MYKKIIVITNIPTPYRVPLFNLVSKELKKKGKEFKVLFCAQKYKRRKWKIKETKMEFNFKIVGGITLKVKSEQYLFITPRLLVYLFKENPSLIIVSGFSFQTLIVYVYTKFKNTPYMIWSGEISSPKFLIKRLWLRLVTQNVKGFLAYGTLAGKWLRRIRDKPIYYVWNTVDTDFYKKITQKIKKEKTKWREKLKFQKENNLGVIGALVKRKGVEELMEIVKKIKEKGVKFSLHIIGDGPLSSQLKEKSKTFNIEKEVKFWGYKSTYEVAVFLGILDLVIFPTLYDIWGLVVNEALASGTPIVISKYAGAVEDLIKKNKEKIVFDPYKKEESAEKIVKVLEDEELRREIIEEGKKLIDQKFNIKKASEGFLEAILHEK